MMAFLALIALIGACAAPPVDWRRDFESARRGLLPDGLLVVQFVVPGQPESDAQQAEIEIAETVRRAMIGVRAVRLDATAESARFKSIFDLGPLLATCIFDAEGRALTARLGYVGPGSLCALLDRARSGRAAVAAASARRASIPAEARTPAQAAAMQELGDAYFASGNSFEAQRLWKVVTMLPAPTPAARQRVARTCNQLARLALAEGDAIDAQDWLELLRESDPAVVDEAAVQLTFAQQARLDGRSDVARKILERLRTRGGEGEPAVLFELAGVCHDAGDNEAAQKLLDDLCARFAKTVWSARATEELQHLATHAQDEKREAKR